MIKKFIFSLILVSIFFFQIPQSAYAALVKVDPQGNIIWQVLGDETSLSIPKPSDIKVKSSAETNTPSPTSQISLNNENGKVTLNGMDVTSLKDNLVEIQARPDSNDLTISNLDGQFVIVENGISAQTSFPITVDPVKNELSVVTPSGSRLISILPYEAVLSLMRAKLINNVKENKINLNENMSGELQYTINGIKNVNLFNIASINANVMSTVSASNGEIVKVNQPQWLKFFGFIWE